LVIRIPDNPEVDELISEITEETTFVSGEPLPASSSHVSCPLCSQQVKTLCYVISESPNDSLVPPDSSNGLVVSAPVHCCNPTISIQPIAGPSHKQGQYEKEPLAVSPPPKKPYHNKARRSFLSISSIHSFLIDFSVFLACDLLQLYGLHSGHLYLNLVPTLFTVPSMKDLVSSFFDFSSYSHCILFFFFLGSGWRPQVSLLYCL